MHKALVSISSTLKNKKKQPDPLDYKVFGRQETENINAKVKISGHFVYSFKSAFQRYNTKSCMFLVSSLTGRW
jgi:hypothetical protein